MAASLAARFYSPLTLNVVNYSVNSSNCCLCSVRHYAKRLRRSAQRVLTPTDEQQLLRKRSGDSDPRKNAYVPFVKDDPVQRSRTEWNSQAPPVVTPNIYTKQKPSVNETTLLNTSKVGKDDIRYEKIAEGDKRFGQVILRAKSRKERDKHNITLLEGFRLIRDAINSGADIKCVYFTDLDFIEGLQLDSLEVPLYKVQYRHLKIWTETQSPSGIMAIVQKPKQGECPMPLESCLPLTLICDNVRDPGNMGTLIRTAAAVGCQRVLTTKGCVDVWEPKVLRAGMGSHFHVPILSGLPWEVMMNYVSDNTQVFLAETQREDIRQGKLKGLSLELENLPDEDHETDLISEEKIEMYTRNYPPLKKGGELSVDETFLDKEHVKSFSKLPLSVQNYDSLNLSTKEVAVIVGGETKGVSLSAKKFAFDRYGHCLTIPMSSVVNSLNSAIAGSLVLYEVRRHLVQHEQNLHNKCVQ